MADIKANAYIQSLRVASEALHCLVVVEEVIISHTYCMLLAAQDWFCHVSLLVLSVPAGTKILLSCGKQIGYGWYVVCWCRTNCFLMLFCCY